MKETSLVLGVSAVSKELFSKVAEVHKDILYGENEKEIKANGRVYWLDRLLESNNRVIEFYGDYWHANPNHYDDFFVVKRGNKIFTAKEIRDMDSIRITNISKKRIQGSHHLGIRL